ncbi:hypothetical protein CM49_04247 [Paenibacillus sp. P1XP2]|nr:hypothetical protein CM49_04247 [Paenibacillus sp. P1XP2]
MHGVVQTATQLKTNDFWIVVDDPNAFLDEKYVMNSTLAHPHIPSELGQPALIEPKDAYPSVSTISNVNGNLSGELIYGARLLPSWIRSRCPKGRPSSGRLRVQRIRKAGTKSG